MPLPVSTRPTIRFPGSAGRCPAPVPGWLLPGKSVAEQFHEHQRLVDVAHAHPLGDGVPEAFVGGGGVPGHGGIRLGVTGGVALVGSGTQARQAAMSARDRLRPAPPLGVPTSGGGKVTA